jgi:single-strand DNA-binding protein
MYNQCLFIGNCGADPESRFTQNGKQVVSFRIACTEKYGGKENTEWVLIVAWEKLAEICQRFIQKGTRVFVSGKMQTRKWQDKDGNDRYTTEIVAREMKILSGGRQKEGGQQGQQNQDNYPDPPYGGMGESVPF